jgi:hypothetical protein
MLRIKDWAEFQHYKDRNPPWIKLHRALLDDYVFCHLPDVSKAHFLLISLFASQNDGKIPEDANFIQAKCSLDKAPDLKLLIDQGLLIPEQSASGVLAECKQDAPVTDSLARSREERRGETEESTARFAEFWQAYPKRVAKPDAFRAWAKLKLHNGDFEKVMEALERYKLSEQWQRDNGQYVPHPATWLNKRRFDDELELPPSGPKRVAAG